MVMVVLRYIYLIVLLKLHEVASQQVFKVRGSAYGIGQQYGRHFQASLKEVLKFKLVQHAQILDEWRVIATSSQSFVQAYAPLYWQELRGIAEGSGISLENLLLLTTEYEADMILEGKDNNSTQADRRRTTSTSKGCTGFALPSTSWIAQTNDDHPSSWADGKWDVILIYEVEELNFEPVFIYTHIGVPAYLGMNSAGLGLT